MRRNKSDSPYALTDLQLRLEGDLLGRGTMLDLPHQQLDALERDLLAGLDDGGHHRHTVADIEMPSKPMTDTSSAPEPALTSAGWHRKR